MWSFLVGILIVEVSSAGSVSKKALLVMELLRRRGISIARKVEEDIHCFICWERFYE
jgi:hypothetical protein